jgi:phosphate starvation-inducible PhoH-like protein
MTKIASKTKTRKATEPKTEEKVSSVLFSTSNNAIAALQKQDLKKIERFFNCYFIYDDGKINIVSNNSRTESARNVAVVLESISRTLTKCGKLYEGEIDDLLKDFVKPPYKETEFGTIFVDAKGNKVAPRTKNQEELVKSISNNTVTIVHGCAGTGKSKLALVMGINYLRDNRFDKLIIVRPICTVGADIGYLPGDLEDKYGPYTSPMYESLSELIGEKALEDMIKLKRIVFTPATFTRGANFKDAYVIIDEAQNLSKIETLTLLTRLSQNTKVVITGDESQSDRKKDKHSDSGMTHCLKAFKDGDIEEINVVKMTDADIQRHRLIGDIIDRFED